MKESTRNRILIGVGLVVLAVPTVILLSLADAAFRERCKILCVERAYRVTTSSRGPAFADCHCIDPADRTVWEKLRDLIS